MRRVITFCDNLSRVTTRVNQWLKDHPNTNLIDIKPLESKTGSILLFVIVEIGEKKED